MSGSEQRARLRRLNLGPTTSQRNPFVNKSEPEPEPETQEPAKSVPPETQSTKPEPTSTKIASEQQEGLTGTDVPEDGPKSKRGAKPKKKVVPNAGQLAEEERLKKELLEKALFLHKAQKSAKFHPRTAPPDPAQERLARAIRGKLVDQFSNDATWRAWCAEVGLFAQVMTGYGVANARPHLHQVLLSPDFRHIAFRVTFPGALDTEALNQLVEQQLHGTASQSSVQLNDPRGPGETLNLVVPIRLFSKGITDEDLPPEDVMADIRSEMPRLGQILDGEAGTGKTPWKQIAHAAGITRTETKQKILNGKAVRYDRIHTPKIVDFGVNRRGPYLDVEPIGMRGQTVTEIRSATERLAQALKAPHLRVEVAGDGLVARINMNLHDVKWPKFTSALPTDFVRPTSENAELSIVKAYPQMVWPIGQTIEGRRMENSFESVPHQIIAGTSGAGKSVSVLGAISAVTVQGCQVVVASGKKGDFKGLLLPGAAPGVLCVAETRASMLRLTAWVKAECERREDVLDDLRAKGIRTTPLVPLIFVFDEYAKFKAEMSKDDKDTVRMWEQAVDHIARAGRSVRVHFVAVTQDVYDASFGERLLGNCTSRISIGPVSSSDGARRDVMVRTKLLNDDEEAARLAATITTGTKGRLVALDSETGEAALCQSPFIYSTGIDPKGMANLVESNWAIWREALRAVPRIRSRFYFEFPAYQKSAEDNWETWNWDQLCEVSPVDLDEQISDGSWRAIEDRMIYDPTSDVFRGNRSVRTTNHAHK